MITEIESLLDTAYAANNFTERQMSSLIGVVRMTASIVTNGKIMLKMDMSYWRRKSAVIPLITRIQCPKCKAQLDTYLHRASEHCPYCQSRTRTDYGVPIELNCRIPIFNYIQVFLQDPVFFEAIHNPAVPCRSHVKGSPFLFFLTDMCLSCKDRFLWLSCIYGLV